MKHDLFSQGWCPRLPTVLREYDKIARECARDGIDHVRYLLRLLELELLDRERRVTERRIRDARFPATKRFRRTDANSRGLPSAAQWASVNCLR